MTKKKGKTVLFKLQASYEIYLWKLFPFQRPKLMITEPGATAPSETMKCHLQRRITNIFGLVQITKLKENCIYVKSGGLKGHLLTVRFSRIFHSDRQCRDTSAAPATFSCSIPFLSFSSIAEYWIDWT